MDGILYKTSNYSSQLTIASSVYYRESSQPTWYFFYEALSVNVSVTGNYSFVFNSMINTYGSIYNNSFNASTPSTNLLASNDDDAGQYQFLLPIFMETTTTYVLVVTTSLPGQTAPFSIIATGIGFVTFTLI